MNLIGKIFTLLIFFMSICFLVVAVMVGAADRKWKQMAIDNKEVAARAKLLLDNAKSKSLDQEKLLNAERVARTHQIAQLQSQLTQAQTKYEETDKLYRDVQVTAQKQLDSLKSAEARLKEQDGIVEQLRGQNQKLIDDVAAKVTAVVNLTNEVYRLKAQAESLDVLNQDLSEQLAKNTKVMKAHGLDERSLTSHIPPKVDGVVLRVKDDIIAVSLGTDDGLRRGHVIDIFRGRSFIGKATVTSEDYNMSAARLDPEFLQASVQEGDHVTTKF